MAAETFKIKGFRISRDTKSNRFYIFFSRTQRRSLKTTDKKQARAIAEKVIEKYLQCEIVSLNKRENPLLSEYLKDYISNRKDLSPNTIEMDCSSIKSLINIVGDKHISELTAFDFKKFKRDQQHRGLSPFSINSYLKHIVAFLNQAKADQIIVTLPIIKKVKCGKKLPRILNPKEQEKILSYSFKIDIELWKIFQFALYTGCRRNEILFAKWENYDGVFLKIIGKGNKERVIPITQKAKTAMGHRKEKGFIFKQMLPTSLSRAFKKIAVECDIKDIHFHNLRHSAATAMLASGVSIKTIQKILGHSNLSTTQIYAKVLDQHLLEEIKKFDNI